jgi:hypothetical protein
MVPREATATRTASNRFRGPSESGSEAGRCAPTRITGFVLIISVVPGKLRASGEQFCTDGSPGRRPKLITGCLRKFSISKS